MSEIIADTVAASDIPDASRIGDAWGDDISDERKAELDTILAAWDAEADHGERKGPFDRSGMFLDKRLQLTGADVFYLAARTLVGVRPKVSIRPIVELEAARVALREPGNKGFLDLPSLNLAGADLVRARLAGANLHAAQLTDATLYRAELTEADLGKAQLSGADLGGAQLVQRSVFVQQGKRGRALLWGFLDLIAGFGYRPGRSLIAYLVAILGFAAGFYLLGQVAGPPFSPDGAIVFSMTSFHGRGFFPGGISLEDPIAKLAALEAFVGLIIEVAFIATFTQRFFGK